MSSASVLLLLDLGKQVRHRRFQGGGELLGNQNRRQSLTSLKKADIVPVKIGFGGQGLLRETSGLPPSSKYLPKQLL